MAQLAGGLARLVFAICFGIPWMEKAGVREMLRVAPDTKCEFTSCFC